MEKTEEKLYCPFCRCELTDLKATTCPKCWGDLTQFLEDNPLIIDEELEKALETAEEKEEVQAEEEKELQISNKKEKSSEAKKTSKKSKPVSNSNKERPKFKYACFACLVIFLLVQIFFLFKIDRVNHNIYKELTAIHSLLLEIK